ncbi:MULTISPECIES: hypothetical protein [Aerosakkonema]|uniref:hypothetical protein n=1 Tax=Aerosakkonema TaxID=1246629 RepID=UPI0035B9DF19
MKKLVMLLRDQMLPPQILCSTCLMASQQGQPRWQDGQLRCGRPVHNPSNNAVEFRCINDAEIIEFEYSAPSE